MLTKHIFSSSSSLSVSPLSKDGNKVFILGSSQSGKTSLAFRMAYEEAMIGGTPLFITQKEKIEKCLPLPISISMNKSIGTRSESQADGSEEEIFNTSHLETSASNTNDETGKADYHPTVLSRIHMKYVVNRDDLVALFLLMQDFQPSPTLIILDDFSSIPFGPYHESNIQSSFGNFPGAPSSSSGSASNINQPIQRISNYDALLRIMGLIDNTINFLSGQDILSNMIKQGPYKQATTSILPTQKSEVVRLVLTDNCQEHLVSRYFDVYITLTKDANQVTAASRQEDGDQGLLTRRPSYPHSESYLQEGGHDIIGGQGQVQGQSRYPSYEVRRVFARERPQMLQHFLDSSISGHVGERTSTDEEIIAKYVCQKDLLVVSLV